MTSLSQDFSTTTTRIDWSSVLVRNNNSITESNEQLSDWRNLPIPHVGTKNKHMDDLVNSDSFDCGQVVEEMMSVDLSDVELGRIFRWEQFWLSRNVSIWHHTIRSVSLHNTYCPNNAVSCMKLCTQLWEELRCSIVGADLIGMLWSWQFGERTFLSVVMLF